MHIWVVSTFWWSWIMVLWTFICRFLCGHMFPVILGTHLGVELPRYMVTLCLAFWGMSRCLPKWLHICILPAMCEGSDLPRPWVWSFVFLHLYVVGSFTLFHFLWEKANTRAKGSNAPGIGSRVSPVELRREALRILGGYRCCCPFSTSALWSLASRFPRQKSPYTVSQPLSSVCLVCRSHTVEGAAGPWPSASWDPATCCSINASDLGNRSPPRSQTASEWVPAHSHGSSPRPCRGLGYSRPSPEGLLSWRNLLGSRGIPSQVQQHSSQTPPGGGIGSALPSNHGWVCSIAALTPVPSLPSA